MDTSINDWVFVNPSTYVDDEVNEILDQIILEYSRAFSLDQNLASLAYGEKEKTKKMFGQIIDQPRFNSDDHNRLRRFIIDWYSTNKTEITKAKKLTDLKLLTSKELNELILSLGFPYPENIINNGNKIKFIQNLVNNYRKKGTLEALISVISLYGLKNIIVSEWWMRYDKLREIPFYAKSKVIHNPYLTKSNESFEIEKSYDEFIRNNPLWQTTYEQFESAFYDSSNLISLPSITSSISIEAHSNLVELEPVIAVFQRKIRESYDFWLGYTLIPIGMITSSNYPVYTQIINDVPDTNLLDSTSNSYFILGLNPSNEWTIDLTNKERHWIIWNPVSQEWTTEEPTNNQTVICDADSISAPNNLLKYNSTSGVWQIYDIPENGVTYVYNKTKTTLTTYVFNGSEWIDLLTFIPESRILDRDENLFRDIALNKFTSLYSLFEVLLAIAYLKNNAYSGQYLSDGIEISSTSSFYDLFKSTIYNKNSDPVSIPSKLKNRTQIYYNNPLKVPLDSGYEDDPTPTSPYRDDIDKLYNTDDAYVSIYNDFMNLIFDTNDTTSYRHKPNIKTARDNKLKRYYTNYTEEADYTNYKNLYPQINAETFLKAINKTFYDEINNRIINENNDINLVLESITSDLEYYVLNTMKLTEIPFAYVQNGGEFVNKKLMPVVEFFKPFRTRILEFISNLEFNNPVHDCMATEDILYLTYNSTLVEKPFPRKMETGKYYTLDEIESTNEYYTLDEDSYLLDHGICTEDVFTMDVIKYFDEPSYAPFDTDITTRTSSDSSRVINNISPRLDINFRDFMTITITSSDGEVIDSIYLVQDDSTFIDEDNDGDIDSVIDPS